MKLVIPLAGILLASALLASSAQAQLFAVGAGGAAAANGTVTCETGTWSITANVTAGTTGAQLLNTVMTQLQADADFLADKGMVYPAFGGTEAIFVNPGSDPDVLFSCDGGTQMPLNGAQCNGFSMTAAVAGVPTLSEWSLILMVGVLALGGALMARRQLAGATRQA